MPSNPIKPHRIALTTCNSTEEAEKLARQLVERRLVACVNVISGVRSFYRWKGEVQEDGEVLLVMKTRVESLPRLEAAVAELHSYDVPEFVVIEVAEGSAAYLKWIDDNVAS